MARFIDVEKIKLTADSMVDDSGDVYVAMSDVRKAIALTPTEDVEKVRHGHWIRGKGQAHQYFCSECNGKESAPRPFCPRCGAKMDRKDGD